MTNKAAVAAELAWPQVHAFRLQRQHLDGRAPKKDLATVVGDIGGAQAQVMSAAELQIAVRARCTVADVRDALWKDRSLVKTWLMRGTLHLARSADLPVFVGAMGRHWVSQMRPSWLKFMQVTEKEFWTICDEIGAALDGTPLTREELIARVGRGRSEHVRQVLKSGWGGMLKPAARNGLLCFGPSRGQSVTFVRPESWLPFWRTVDPEQAIVEMARRYLRVYGPATQFDFARWWGAWPGVANAAWNGLANELATVSVESWRAELLAQDLPVIKHAKLAGSVQLLPLFDPYLMSCQTRPSRRPRLRREGQPTRGLDQRRGPRRWPGRRHVDSRPLQQHPAHRGRAVPQAPRGGRLGHPRARGGARQIDGRDEVRGKGRLGGSGDRLDGAQVRLALLEAPGPLPAFQAH